jgi:hypothetical protein
VSAESGAAECGACRECMMVVGRHANVGTAAAAGTAMQRGGGRAGAGKPGKCRWVQVGWCRAVRAGGSLYIYKCYIIVC